MRLVPKILFSRSSLSAYTSFWIQWFGLNKKFCLSHPSFTSLQSTHQTYSGFFAAAMEPFSRTLTEPIPLKVLHEHALKYFTPRSFMRHVHQSFQNPLQAVAFNLKKWDAHVQQIEIHWQTTFCRLLQGCTNWNSHLDEATLYKTEKRNPGF